MRRILIALLATLSAQAVLAQDRPPPLPPLSFANPPSAMEQAPHIPEGQLQLLRKAGDATVFMALGDLSRRGALVEATLLLIPATPETRAGQPAAMVVSRQAIECDHRTFATYHAWYAEGGRLLDAERAFTPKPLQPDTVSALLASHVCDDAPAGPTVEGHAAALALARR
jgi:hypothetical protein